MKNLNFLIIAFLSAIMSYCLFGFIRENSALEFMLKIDVMPMAAWKMPVVAISLSVVFLLLLSIQSTSNTALFFKLVLEIAVSFCISAVIGFSYTGIVLLVLVDTMRYIPSSKGKMQLAIVICILYLLIYYNLISAYYKITALKTYLEYFQSGARSLPLGTRNALTSLNMAVFLVYVVAMVRAQQNEKERILSLNEELKQANLRLAEYAKESKKAVEARERNRLAREIHDTLGHFFVGIITGIEACATLMDVAPDATKVQLMAIAEVARQGMTNVRRSVKALRPDALEKLDLENALTQMITEIKSADINLVGEHIRKGA